MAITLNQLKKEEVKKMSFEDIFLTPEYKNDLIGLMNTACLRVGLKKAVRLVIKNMPEDGDIAYTDGDTIYINLGAKFASRLKEKPYLFHTYVVGLLAHELGHIFWTEFEDGMTYMESIQKGIIYPSIPQHPNSQKYQDALSNGFNRQIFQQICHTVDNILEDIYVNALQKEMLGGLYSYGINLGNIMITEEMLSIEQQKEAGYYDFNIIMNCLLTRLKSGSVIYGHYDVEYKDAVEKIEDIANKYIFKPTHKERVEGINLIICELWDYIEDMIDDIKQNASNNNGENGEGGEGGSDSTSNNGSSGSNNSGSTKNNDNSGQNSGNADEQDNNGSGGVSGGSSSDESDNGDNGKGDKEGQQGASNGANSQKEDGDNSSSSGSSKSGESEEKSNGTDGDKNRDTNGDSSDDNGKSNSSSNKNEGEIDNDLLNEILKKVIDQLQGQTQESQNQQDSNIAGHQKVIPANTPNLDDSLKESLNKKVETGRFPISTGEAIAAEGAGSTTYEKLSPAEIEARSQLQNLLDNLSEERAIQKNSEFVSQEMAQEVKDIDFGDIHAGINKKIYRVAGNSSDAKRAYEFIKKQVLPISNKLEKVILRTIKEENLTGERRGRYYGKLLDTSRLYRPDIRVFKDRKQPKKEIDTAFYLLVDISGSMCGNKISTARLVSVLFAETCEKLGIPLEITGHTTTPGGRGIGLYSFICYNSLNKNDKYSLVFMEDKYANRDGAAIIYGCERLLKRPEQKKVFCIISDGQPADYGYSGETAKSDMKHIKNKYTKDGIVFCAAAIDSDKEFIKEIFGKNFLNISHLESLPQTFGKILQNAVLND